MTVLLEARLTRVLLGGGKKGGHEVDIYLQICHLSKVTCSCIPSVHQGVHSEFNAKKEVFSPFLIVT